MSKFKTGYTSMLRVEGNVSSTLRESCLYACKRLELIPKVIRIVNRSNAIVYAKTVKQGVPKNEKIYVRVLGTQEDPAERTIFSPHPEMIEKGWASKAANMSRHNFYVPNRARFSYRLNILDYMPLPS